MSMHCDRPRAGWRIVALQGVLLPAVATLAGSVLLPAVATLAGSVLLPARAAAQRAFVMCKVTASNASEAVRWYTRHLPCVVALGSGRRGRVRGHRDRLRLATHAGQQSAHRGRSSRLRVRGPRRQDGGARGYVGVGGRRSAAAAVRRRRDGPQHAGAVPAGVHLRSLGDPDRDARGRGGARIPPHPSERTANRTRPSRGTRRRSAGPAASSAPGWTRCPDRGPSGCWPRHIEDGVASQHGRPIDRPPRLRGHRPGCGDDRWTPRRGAFRSSSRRPCRRVRRSSARRAIVAGAGQRPGGAGRAGIRRDRVRAGART